MMNYCATHNQFYSAHCVYCGPPAVSGSPTTVIPFGNQAGTCGACGATLLSGLAHICMTAGRLAGNAPGYHVCAQGAGTTCVVCGKSMVATSGFITTVDSVRVFDGTSFETKFERPNSSGSSHTDPLGRKSESSS
jgi:hypothetical protein